LGSFTRLPAAGRPAFVRSPQCNGVIDRFNRTLQEQVFDVHQFENLKEAQRAIAQFIRDYNKFWMIERLGYQSPQEWRVEREEKFLLKSA